MIGSNNKRSLPFVEYYNSSDYFGEAAEFAKIYRHYSTNPYGFELFCLQRWFIINEFIKKQDIESFLHIDSDVLLYSDFSKEKELLECISQYDMSVSYLSLHTSFFNSQNVLERFCNFITGVFENEEFFKQFEQYPEKTTIAYNKNPQIEIAKPLSDMTLAYFYTKSGLVNAINTTNEIIDNALVDVNFLAEPNYSSIGSIAYAVFDKNNTPYKYSIEHNKLIRMHSIHFQGWKKRLMQKFATYDKNESISCIKFDCKDIENIFNVRLKYNSGKTKRSFRRILSNIIEIFIPSRELRSKIRTKLVGSWSENL